jgi:DNA-directed RNA polymerase specialized sigma24 family protein
VRGSRSDDSDGVGEAAQRLSAAFAADGSRVREEDYERVRSALLTVLLVRASSLGAAELCEVADEATTRLLEESRRQGRALDSSFAWLRTTAVNLAIDRLRRGRVAPLEDESIEDELPARLREKFESKDQVLRGLDVAIAKHDDIVVQVVTDYLDLADEGTGFPSSREVAERCGYSHTTVLDTLKRFARYLG